MKPREACIRKSRDSCQSCYRPPKPNQETRRVPGFLYHIGMLHIRDNYTSAKRFSSERQLQKGAHSLLFRSNDIPFFYPSIQRMVFYLLSFLFQFQEHLDLISNQSFWAATFSKPPSSPSCSRVQAANGEEKLWELALAKHRPRVGELEED